VYLAGLWKEDIEDQLCWSSLKAQKRPAYRAPSWSWASVDGGVSYHSSQEGVLEERYAHLVDAKMDLLGLDPFGQVSSGEIRIACSGMLAGHVSELDRELSGRIRDASMMIAFADGEDPFIVHRDCTDIDFDMATTTVYLLPMVGGRSGSGYALKRDADSIDTLVVYGVLLRETGIKKGQFCRIGAFTVRKNSFRMSDEEEEFPENRDLFLRVLEESGETIAKSVCTEVIADSERPKERYVITIV
jgi:hypothetical protein